MILLTLILFAFPFVQNKNGMTWGVMNKPSAQNNWVGKVGCGNCYLTIYGQGDTPCTQKRPILCITGWKSTPRPYYNYGPLQSPHAVRDNGFYNGWSGGKLEATPKIRGTALTSRSAADAYCRSYFGPNSRIAEHHDGFYMNYMNGPASSGGPSSANAIVGADWRWRRRGGWGLWGEFGKNVRCERMWAWIQTTSANCGVTDYRT